MDLIEGLCELLFVNLRGGRNGGEGSASGTEVVVGGRRHDGNGAQPLFGTVVRRLRRVSRWRRSFCEQVKRR